MYCSTESRYKTTGYVHIITDYIFKPGMLATGWYMPGFLKLFLCGRCLCVCVSAPEAIFITSGMIWQDMGPI